jgi:hypothetical protein
MLQGTLCNLAKIAPLHFCASALHNQAIPKAQISVSFAVTRPLTVLLYLTNSGSLGRHVLSDHDFKGPYLLWPTSFDIAVIYTFVEHQSSRTLVMYGRSMCYLEHTNTWGLFWQSVHPMFIGIIGILRGVQRAIGKKTKSEASLSARRFPPQPHRTPRKHTQPLSVL